jgi:hypothetical protein
MSTYPGTIKIAHRHMNVKTGAQAALFPEKEYISGIFLAVCEPHYSKGRVCREVIKEGLSRRGIIL